MDWAWNKQHTYLAKLNEYKDLAKASSLTVDEAKKELEGKDYIVSFKIDGELCLGYFDGSKAELLSREGRVRTDLPVTRELESLLAGKGKVVTIGELHVVDANNQPIPYPQAVSILRNPKTPEEENRIHYLVFDLVETDGKDWFKSDYATRMEKVAEYCKGEKVYPAFISKGSSEILDKMWEDVNSNKGFEGIFITIAGRDFDEEARIKIRPQYPQDLIILGIQPEEEHEGMMGALLLAYMSDKGYHAAGKVGTGFKFKEREWFFDYAEKNQVQGPDDDYIWVKPELVVEIKSDAVNTSDQPIYKFDGGKYTKVGSGKSGIGRKPVYVRLREDKKPTPSDVRLEQIPGWSKMEKKADMLAIEVVEPEILPEIKDKDQFMPERCMGDPQGQLRIKDVPIGTRIKVLTTDQEGTIVGYGDRNSTGTDIDFIVCFDDAVLGTYKVTEVHPTECEIIRQAADEFINAYKNKIDSALIDLDNHFDSLKKMGYTIDNARFLKEAKLFASNLISNLGVSFSDYNWNIISYFREKSKHSPQGSLNYEANMFSPLSKSTSFDLDCGVEVSSEAFEEEIENQDLNKMGGIDSEHDTKNEDKNSSTNMSIKATMENNKDETVKETKENKIEKKAWLKKKT